MKLIALKTRQIEYAFNIINGINKYNKGSRITHTIVAVSTTVVETEIEIAIAIAIAIALAIMILVVSPFYDNDKRAVFS